MQRVAGVAVETHVSGAGVNLQADRNGWRLFVRCCQRQQTAAVQTAAHCLAAVAAFGRQRQPICVGRDRRCAASYAATFLCSQTDAQVEFADGIVDDQLSVADRQPVKGGNRWRGLLLCFVVWFLLFTELPVGAAVGCAQKGGVQRSRFKPGNGRTPVEVAFDKADDGCPRQAELQIGGAHEFLRITIQRRAIGRRADHEEIGVGAQMANQPDAEVVANLHVALEGVGEFRLQRRTQKRPFDPFKDGDHRYQSQRDGGEPAQPAAARGGRAVGGR